MSWDLYDDDDDDDDDAIITPPTTKARPQLYDATVYHRRILHIIIIFIIIIIAVVSSSEQSEAVKRQPPSHLLSNIMLRCTRTRVPEHTVSNRAIWFFLTYENMVSFESLMVGFIALLWNKKVVVHRWSEVDPKRNSLPTKLY